MLPPLRERKEDIPLLINEFVNKYIKDTNMKRLEFSKEAFDLLMKYNYPGNIRELENIIHHAIVLSRDEIITTNEIPVISKNMSREKDLESYFDEGTSLTEKVETLEKTLVTNAH